MILLLLLALVQVIGAAQLEGAELLPACARQCVYDKLPQNAELGKCNGNLSCLCGSNAKPYQDVLWSCIDDPTVCLAGMHDQAVNSVMTVCDSVLPPASTRANNTVTALATATATATATAPAGKEDNDAGKGGDGGLSAGAIAGIVVGALGLLSLLVGIPFLAIILRNRKRRRDEIRSMVLEPPSAGQPSREWKSGGDGSGNGYPAAWTSINSNDASPTSGSHFYHSKSQLTPIVTDIAPAEKTEPDTNYLPYSSASPISPVSPVGDPAGGASVKSVVVGSRKIIENPQLEVDLAPAFNATPSMATTRVAQGEIMSPVSPLSDFAHVQLPNTTSSPSASYHGILPGQALTTNSHSGSSPILEDASSARHTCSAVAMPRGERVNTPDSHGSPVRGTPVISSETAESKRASQSSSTRGATTAAAGGAMARTDSVAWRKELEEAAGRAMTRVVQSEQSIHEETIAERRRKGSIPGLELFARRSSRGDEESSLVSSGETGSSFWSRKHDRVSAAPKSPGFFSPGRRRNSGATA